MVPAVSRTLARFIASTGIGQEAVRQLVRNYGSAASVKDLPDWISERINESSNDDAIGMVVTKARTAVKALASRQRRDTAIARTQQQVITGLHQLATQVGDGSLSTPGFVDAATALMRASIHEGLRLGVGHALVDAGRATQRQAWANKADAGLAWVDGMDGRFGLYAGSIPHAYETGYGLATIGANDDPDNIVIKWHARPDCCKLCDGWSQLDWTAGTLPGMPGDGGFGKAATVCLGGRNCRCHLSYHLVTPDEVAQVKARHADRASSPQQLDDGDTRAQDAAAIARALADDDPQVALARVLDDMATVRAEKQRSWLMGLLKAILTAATRGAAAVQSFLVTKEFHPDELRDDHGRWTVIGAATHELTQLLGKATTQEAIQKSYGDAVDGDEFAPGAHLEIGDSGDLHIDIAGTKEDTYHVFADMSQDDASLLSDELYWALGRAEEGGGHRPADPVNGLQDWKERDGVVVGYTPDGRIHFGWPISPYTPEGDYITGRGDWPEPGKAVLDLNAIEAHNLADMLAQYAQYDESDGIEKSAKAGRGQLRVWRPCAVPIRRMPASAYANPPSGRIVKADKTPAVDAATVIAQMRENYPPKALGWMKGAQWSGPAEVPLDQVDFDDMDKWAASRDKSRVKHFAKKLRGGKQVNPVVAVQEPGGDKIKIIDGHHRTLAARKVGQPVRAYVGAVTSNGGPWDETHSFQVHDGASPSNGEEKTGPVAAGLAVRAADTGRVLMLHRALPVEGEEDDPAAGHFEMPGGKLDDGEQPIQAARREWAEETGCPVPKGTITGQWASVDGVYHGFVLTIPHEDAVPIFGDRDHIRNPDNPDPDGDPVEALAWWDPAHLIDNPAVRPELAESMPAVLRAMKVPKIEKAFNPGEARDPHGQWTHLGEIVRDALHSFTHGDVATSLHEDGSIGVTMHPEGAAEHIQLHAEDVSSLNEGIDTALTDIEGGHSHESSILTTTGEATLHGDRTGLTLRHGDSSLRMTPAEAEQFAQHLDELATAHRPTILTTHRVSPDLTFDQLSNDRIGVTLGESSTPEPVTFDASEAADLAEILRTDRPVPTSELGDEREQIDGERIHPNLAVTWWSDGSASIDVDSTEVHIPADQVDAAAAVLRVLADRLGPTLTAKGARLVRQLARRALLEKVEEGEAGRYRARHLIRWFEHGEGAGKIGWGTEGDFDRCTDLAAEHMTVEQAHGFCNLRHKGALGYYPATHAAMERGHIKKGHPYPGQRFYHGWIPVDSLASGEKHRTPLGGAVATTHLVHFNDGTRAVHKVMHDDPEQGPARDQADKEELAPLVAAAMGVKTPTVHRSGDHEVYMDHIEGVSGNDHDWSDSSKAERQMQMIQFFDEVIGNSYGDRHGENLIVTPAEDVYSIDHSAAWAEGADPYLESFDVGVADNPYSEADMVRIRRRMEALRPEFDRLGRGDWLDQSLRWLDRYAADPEGEEDLVT